MQPRLTLLQQESQKDLQKENKKQNIMPRICFRGIFVVNYKQNTHFNLVNFKQIVKSSQKSTYAVKKITKSVDFCCLFMI